MRLTLLFLILSLSCQTKNTRPLFTKTIGQKGKLYVPLVYTNNIDSAKLMAYKTNRPILILFYADACLSDRAQQWKQLTEPKITQLVNSKYVLLALELTSKKVVKTYPNTYPVVDTLRATYLQQGICNTEGEINCQLQVNMFKSNSQPLMAVLDSNFNILCPAANSATTFFYDKLKNYLEEGLKQLQ